MVRIAGDTLPHEIRGRNGILLRNTAAEVDGKWCTVGVGGLIPVGGPADSLIGWVALVAGRQRPYPIRDGNRHHTGVTGFAAALSAEVARSPGHDLFDLLPTPRSSIGYRYDWTTRLDKIKNFHSLESIDTENSDTRGRSGWVHSSRGGALRQSRALQQPAGEGGALGTGVARNLGTDPRLGHPKLSQTSRDR